MTQESRIDVINREGWRKEFTLRRSILYVGSQPGVDIFLPQPEIAPRHLQFVPSSVNRLGYRVINLSSVDVLVRPRANGGLNAPRVLAPRSSIEIADGDTIALADYSLVFQGGAQTSQVIQARVEITSTRIDIDQPLEGAVVIKNAGDKAGVQFLVEIQGWDPKLLQIEPGPVLFPDVEKRCGFRLLHPKQPLPVAGEQTVTFVVTAPADYPGESAVMAQAVTVAPFFAHKVRVIAIDPQMADFVLP
jgi:hypothetical protein